MRHMRLQPTILGAYVVTSEIPQYVARYSTDGVLILLVHPAREGKCTGVVGRV